MSLPAVRACRERFPQAHIAVLARPWVADLYASESAVDRTIVYDAQPGLRDFRKKLQIARELRSERFDCAILLQNAFEAAALARLAGVPDVIGYNRDGRGWLLSRAVPVPRRSEIPVHERFYYLELLKRAELIRKIPASPNIRFEGVEAFAAAGRNSFRKLGITQPVIGLSPGAAYGTAKRWLPERFADTAIELAGEHRGAVCLFGSRSERDLCAAIAERIAPHAPVFNLAGETSLRGFMEQAAPCLIFLTNDSGAMHIASALGVPTVTIFGATNPETTGPTGDRARIVREPVPCSPCLLRECPIDHRCMTGVPALRVVETARGLLSIAGAKPA